MDLVAKDGFTATYSNTGGRGALQEAVQPIEKQNAELTTKGLKFVG